MVEKRKIRRIGFISTRFQGTDGVSLETEKWHYVLKKLGYDCYFFAGLSDWNPKKTMIMEEAFFDHPEIEKISHKCFGTFTRDSKITEKIHDFRHKLKKGVYRFIKKFNLDLIIIENALAIPMNIPFALALTELIAETEIATIAHHHDFYWERQRFMVNCINDYIKMAFPPSLPSIQHVVINSQGDKDLSYRRGLSAYVVPNVFNYSKEAPGIDNYNKNVRQDLGLKEDDIFFLQPTRVIARKGIEHSIEVVHRMKNPKIKLVITHQAKDEGKDYEKRIKSYAKLLKVSLIIKPEIIGAKREINKYGQKVYTLWDIYPHADFITYPSTYEGFGNAFLETIYFKKPILVNRYSIFEKDIEPLGFDVVAMDTYVEENVIKRIQKLLTNSRERKKMVETNYKLASQFFSYEVLAHKLENMIIGFEGIPSGERRIQRLLK
ncbi:glycosyltransferase [Candidatus Auribacterota bacterium]